MDEYRSILLKVQIVKYLIYNIIYIYIYYISNIFNISILIFDSVRYTVSRSQLDVMLKLKIGSHAADSKYIR